jgi:hypothetical protein
MKNKTADEFLKQLKNELNLIILDVCSKVPSRAIPDLDNQFELGKRNTCIAIIKYIEKFQEKQKLKENKK